jgi:hypothetical protein
MSRSQHSGVSVPFLRPGIYLIDLDGADAGLRYIIFWPEDSTWEDNSLSSVSRNRVTFMRCAVAICLFVVLTLFKISDQIVWSIVVLNFRRALHKPSLER